MKNKYLGILAIGIIGISILFGCGKNNENSLNTNASEEYFRWKGDEILAVDFYKLKEKGIRDIVIPKRAKKAAIIVSEEYADSVKFESDEDIDLSGSSIEVKVELPKKLTCIPDSIFKYNKCIETIEIGEYVKKIGKYAFSETDLKEIKFHKDGALKEIDEYAFSGTNMKHLDLPDNLEKIGQGAFQRIEEGCTVILPKKIKIIEDAAFWSSSLNIYFPKEVELTEVANEAFMPVLIVYHVTKDSWVDKNLRTILDLGRVSYE